MSREVFISREIILGEQVKAVAGIVISTDGKILVGTEQIDKLATDKKVGQTSIPFETLKQFEISEENMLHALLTEISTDESMDDLRGFIKSAGVIGIVEVAPRISVAVLLLQYDGDSSFMPFNAPHPEEFSDIRWTTIEDLERPDAFVRSYVFPVIDHIKEISILDTSFKTLEFDGFTPSIYEDWRQMSPDVILDRTT